MLVLCALNLHLQLSKLRETTQAAEQSSEVTSASPVLHCIGTIQEFNTIKL